MDVEASEKSLSKTPLWGSSCCISCFCSLACCSALRLLVFIAKQFFISRQCAVAPAVCLTIVFLWLPLLSVTAPGSICPGNIWRVTNARHHAVDGKGVPKERRVLYSRVAELSLLD